MVGSSEPNEFVMYKNLLETHIMDNGCECNFFLGGNTCFAAYQDSTYHPVDTNLSLNVPKYKQAFAHYHRETNYYIHYIFSLDL